MRWRRAFWPLSGRLNRKGFLIGAGLLWLLPELVALIIALPAGWAVASTDGSARAFDEALSQGRTALALVLLYWQGSLFARRFHDIGWTGWLALVPLAFPAMRLVNKLYGGGSGRASWSEGPFSGVGSALVWTVVAWAVAWLLALFWPGQSRANRHGREPTTPWGDAPAEHERVSATFA